ELRPSGARLDVRHRAPAQGPPPERLRRARPGAPAGLAPADALPVHPSQRRLTPGSWRSTTFASSEARAGWAILPRCTERRTSAADEGDEGKRNVMLASEFGTGQVFWSMLWFFLFFIWIWILIMVFADLFRSHDLSGWAKAAWVIFVIILPYLGVFV